MRSIHAAGRRGRATYACARSTGNGRARHSAPIIRWLLLAPRTAGVGSIHGSCLPASAARPCTHARLVPCGRGRRSARHAAGARARAAAPSPYRCWGAGRSIGRGARTAHRPCRAPVPGWMIRSRAQRTEWGGGVRDRARACLRADRGIIGREKEWWPADGSISGR